MPNRNNFFDWYNELDKLNEDYETSKKEYSQNMEVLRTQLKTVKEKSMTESKESKSKIDELTSLLESRNNDFKNISELYVKQNCQINGVDEESVKEMLGESYDSTKVVSAMKSATDYNFRMKSLPFELGTVSARVVKEDFETPKKKSEEDLSSLQRILTICKQSKGK